MTATLPATVSIGTPPQVYRPTGRWLTLQPQGRPVIRYPIYANDDGGEIVAAWLDQVDESDS